MNQQSKNGKVLYIKTYGIMHLPILLDQALVELF